MAETRRCPQCGAELPRGDLAGLCRKCLVRVTFETPAQPLSAPVGPPPNLRDATLEVTIPDTALEGPGTRIGRYKLLDKIGEGGFGVVYLAVQIEPVQRQVALKIIKAGMDTREVIARFEAERQALALMDHPNIAQIFDGGVVGAFDSQPSTLNSQLSLGRPYFVMEWVRGLRITEYCDRRHLSTTDRLQLFMQVCHAVQHAHQKGIIHRDLKPSNVLVTDHDGKPVPKVIDFGIAKALGQKLTDKTFFTGVAQMIGTPAYMSPEQAEPGGLDVDTRSDIYSLGVLLYELLTGVTPFGAETFRRAALDEVRRIIRETDPPRPSTRLRTLGDKLTDVAKRRQLEPPKLIHQLRGDLDWIVMKCLEKDRARRYETANNVALDIEHHLQHEPVSAAAPSRLYQAQKFVRRHKAGLAVASMFLLLLTAGVVASTWQAVRATRAESKEKVQRQRAEELRATAEEQARQIGCQLYASQMNMGLKAWQNGDLAGALAVLDRYQPQPGQTDLRGFEWFYLWRLCHSEQLVLSGHDARVRAVAFSPDGRWLLSGGDDGNARLWEAASGRAVAVLSGHTNWVSAVAFSPDGQTLATGSKDRTVRLWDPSLRRELAVLGEFTNEVGALAFSPDGRWLAASSATLATGSGNPENRFVVTNSFPAEVKVWDAVARTEITTLRGHQAGVQTLAFAPDGKTLATASTDGGLILWNLPAGTQRTNFGRLRLPVLAVAFSPDGARLAVGGGDPYGRETFLELLDLGTGRAAPVLQGHRSAVFALAFSPDGQSLATAGLGQTVRLWSCATGSEFLTIRGHKAAIWSLAFDPAGQRLATASWDHTVKVWDVHQPQEFDLPVRRSDYCVHFSPNAEYLACGGFRTQILKLGSREPPIFLPDYTNADALTAWSPDGALLATAGMDQLITLWQTGTWRKLAVLEGQKVKIWSLAFSPDGQTLASGGDIKGPTVRLWDVAARRARAVLRMHTSTVACLAFTPDGRSLLAGSWNEIVCVDPKTAQEQWRLKEPGPRFAISPDGRWLAVTAKPNSLSLRLVELASKQVKWTIRPHNDGIWAVTFSPDGKTLATASWDGTAKLWNVASGQEIFRYEAPGVVWTVAFSPDGAYWAVGSGRAGHGEVALFHAATPAQVARGQ